MKKLMTATLLLAALTSSHITLADVLTLKDGQTLTGSLVSRDANGVVFDIAGQQLTFKSENIKSLSFGNEVAAPEVPPQPQPETPVAKAEEKTAKDVIAPAGTRVIVTTNTTLNSRQHKTGHKFTARLEADMVIDGVVIAPRGAAVYGVISASKGSGRLVGKSQMQIDFTDIMLNNQMLSISSSDVNAVTEGTGKRTVGTTARTAAIGGLINGSKGAKDGAKVGLGLSVLSSGNSINIPAGTMLEFQLTAPFSGK